MHFDTIQHSSRSLLITHATMSQRELDRLVDDRVLAHLSNPNLYPRWRTVSNMRVRIHLRGTHYGLLGDLSENTIYRSLWRLVDRRMVAYFYSLHRDIMFTYAGNTVEIELMSERHQAGA